MEKVCKIIFLDEINQCCYNHDECYDFNKGKYHCDLEFVNCLSVLKADYPFVS